MLLIPAHTGSVSRGAPVHGLHLHHPPTDLQPCRNYLKGEESRCHGTRVLTWSGRAVPNARVTDSHCRRCGVGNTRDGLATGSQGPRGPGHPRLLPRTRRRAGRGVPGANQSRGAGVSREKLDEDSSKCIRPFYVRRVPAVGEDLLTIVIASHRVLVEDGADLGDHRLWWVDLFPGQSGTIPIFPR
jgi:hypothetical protein